MDDVTPLTFNFGGDGWHLKPRRQWLQLFAPTVLTLAITYGVVVAARQGKPLPAALLVCWAVYFGLMPFMILLRGRPGRPVPRHHGDLAGLLIPQRRPSLLRQLWFGLGAVMFGGFGVVGCFFVLRDGEWGMSIPMLCFVAIGAGMGAACLGTARKRRATERGVLLTPAGVRIHTHPQEGPLLHWEAIERIYPFWARLDRMGTTSPNDFINNYVGLAMAAGQAPPPGQAQRVDTLLSGSRDPCIDVDDVLVPPQVLLDILRFYHRSPDARAELGSDAALARYDSVEREGLDEGTQ